jgi:outer membrane protein OmpA-like peptidoglycan-associated protein
VKGIAFCALLLGSIAVYGQGQRDTLRLYFKINEISSATNISRIDSLYKKLGSRVFNLWIYGYADFLNTNDYNDALSQRRADAVRAHFLKLSSSPQMNILACKGMGEKFSNDNGSNDGEWKQRRVDVIYELREPVRVVDTRPQTVAEPDTQKKELEEMVSGEKLELEGLSFIPGRHIILKSSAPVLNKLLKTLKKNPGLRIEIQGHVCCSPDDSDGYDYDTGDKKLSVNRARAVYEFLLKNGIEASRLRYKGLAHTMPKVEENTPEDEQMNRRVEIMVID